MVFVIAPVIMNQQYGKVNYLQLGLRDDILFISMLASLIKGHASLEEELCTNRPKSCADDTNSKV